MRKSFLFGILISLFIGNCNTLHAQTDTEFWFAVPEITNEHGDDPIIFVFTTNEFAADVTIEMPAEPAFTPVSLFIPAYTSDYLPILQTDPKFTLIENTTIIDQLSLPVGSRNNISNKAIRITSTAPINAYFSRNLQNNSDIYSLKGSNGIGSEFIIPFQEHGYNQHDGYIERGFSSLEIIGIEDGTIIEITPPAGKDVYQNGTSPNQTNPFTININRGEVYTLPPGWDPTVVHNAFTGWWKVEGYQHLGGIIVKVISGNGVAVVKKDDSVRFGSDVGTGIGGWDIIADQCVPYKGLSGKEGFLGTEYAAMRGNLDNGWEFVYAAAPENNTRIWWGNNIDTIANPIPNSIIDKGEQEGIQFDNDIFTNNILEIISNKTLSALHISGSGTEMGGAILPPIDKCTGSPSVSFSRAVDWPMYLNIMVKNGAENDFLFEGVVRNDLIDPSSFVDIGASGEWKATQIIIPQSDFSDFPVGIARTISNTENIFHLGVIHGGGPGCRYGYFSDFSELAIDASIIIEDGTQPSSTARVCAGETIQLHATGGNVFEWWPQKGLSDPTVVNPTAIAEMFITYYVKVSGSCRGTDTATVSIEVFDTPVAQFSVDNKKGCSPLSINIANNSTGEDSVFIDYGDGAIYKTSTLDIINHIYVNKSSSVDTNIIVLTVKNNEGCTDYHSDTIIIFPEVKADFTIDGNIFSGCNSLDAIFTNTSNYGTHVASEFLWTFGDGLDSISNATTINYEYINNANNDVVYNFNLYAESQYGCVDDTTNSIIIYKALANFEVNVDQGCSPLEVSVTNKSVGAQISSWDWDFDDLTTSIVQNPLPKTFKNSTGVTAIQNMQLTVTGTNGCNTSKTIPVTIFSSVDAQFTSDFKEGCNPLSVNYSNTSINASSNFWNFGNGETSTLSSPSHLYNNTNVYDKIFNVSLKIESENGCSDDTSALITVYSNILSDFTINLKEGCSTLNTTINNTSIGNSTDTYQWFIDNVPITDSPTNNSNFNHNFDNSGSTINNNEIKLIATNQHGCTSEHIDTITTYPKPVTEITDSSNVSCFGAEDGFVSVSVLSGIPPYIYMWSTGETNPTLTGINGGIYTLTVSDANACSSINTVIINEPPQTSIDIESTDISCNGATDGTLAVTPNNEITSFLWSTGSTDSIISNLSSGLYAITVTNNDGCVSIETYNILEPDSISIITDSYTESICPSQVGQIEISVYGGTPTYSYIWSSGENTQDIYNLDAGNYNISVVDINGCFSSKNYIIDSVSSYNDEEICFVGINPEVEMNEIIWNRTPDQGIIYYKVYRHNPNADLYQNVALLPFNDGGNFIDSLANIQNEALKYKISSINKCATESSLSGFHKSLYLNITNTSEILMLEWEAYEIESGNPDIIGYIIYRGSDPTTMNPIDTISNNESNYIDNDPESLINEFYYRIVGIKSSACILSTDNEFNLIYSNLVKNDINTSIEMFSDQSINLKVFPNPFKDEISIEYELYSKSNIVIEIYDIIGKKVTTLKKNKEDIGFYKHLFNPKDYGYSSGIYYIKLIIDDHTINKKIIQIK